LGWADFGKSGPFAQKAQKVAPHIKFNRFEKLTSKKKTFSSSKIAYFFQILVQK
jgi:hypothetical protein